MSNYCIAIGNKYLAYCVFLISMHSRDIAFYSFTEIRHYILAIPGCSLFQYFLLEFYSYIVPFKIPNFPYTGIYCKDRRAVSTTSARLAEV